MTSICVQGCRPGPWCVTSDNALSIDAFSPLLHFAAAGPLTATFQTALLANYAGSTSLAAYAAVNISANFATRVFNFLVDGVSAKVGSSVGEQDWEVLAFRVKLSLMW